MGILGVADGGEINSNENENGGANDGGDSNSRKLISQSGFECKIITKDRSGGRVLKSLIIWVDSDLASQGSLFLGLNKTQ